MAGIPGFAARTLLWFWGHEHRLAAYDKFQVAGLNAYGRCIGHGGMPVDRGEPKVSRARPLMLYDDRSYDPSSQQVVAKPTDFGVNGYAMLKLRGATATVSYCDIRGEQIASETWEVRSEGNVSPKGDVVIGPTVRREGKRLVMADPAGLKSS